jgi:hypothetical protein
MRLKILMLLLVVGLKPIAAFSQWKNNEWRWGYDVGWGLPYGGTNIKFNTDTFSILYEPRNINFNGTYSGLTTPDSQFSIYTNGYTLANKNHDTIMNGSGLSPGGTYNTWAWIGYPVASGAVLVPYPGSSTLMAMVHMDQFQTGTYHAENIYFSLIDPSGNNGQGLVMIKNQLVANDTFNQAALMVNRHANGRDWWILVKRNYLNDFFTFLLTPTGIELKQIQSMGGPNTRFGGQGSFSPDGKTLAGFNSDYQLRIYDFDRCTGTLSNMRYKYITNLTAGGLSFSPNSRFLYISYYEKLWQFDLQNPDVLNTQTLIANLDTTFHDPVTGYYPSWAFHYLAADGKIYVQNFNGVMLCVINKPDESGQSCNFVQNQIQGPTIYYSTVPTYINLNLMQEPGSPCDTLGVGNEKLIISNEELKIYPNPNNGNFDIEYPLQQQSGMLYVYDINGKEVYKEYVSPYTFFKNLSLQNTLKPGMYAISMVFGEVRNLGKFVLQ